MGDPASPIRYVRRSERWLDLVASGPIAVPAELLAIPGIRYVEPEFGHPDPIWKLEIPSTTWGLQVVLDALPKPAWSLIFNELGQSPPILVQKTEGLYAHQQQAVEFLIVARGGLLCDQVGLGKSRPAAVAAHLLSQQSGMHGPLGARPVLIVAPRYLRETWRKEIEAVAPGASFRALTGITPRALDRTDFIFIHYDIVHAWWSQITVLRPGAVILDEAHTIRNARTRRGKAAQLAASVAPYRILLTGTPILNRPGEVLALLELVTGKWSWGTPSRFRERYAGAVRDSWGLRDGVPTHTEEFQARLASCMLRRTPEDIGLDLPPVTRDVVYVDLTDAQREKYATLFEGYSADDVINAILHNRGSKKTFEWLGKLRKLASDAKFQTTKDLVANLVSEGEHVVTFCWRRETVERLRDVLKTPTCCRSWLVHGGRTQLMREQSLTEFAMHGGSLTATYDALATGVTLSKARIVVLHDLDWVPATMLQGEGRVTGALRRGTKHCVSKWIVARGTLDELMIRIVGLKGNAIESLAADKSAAALADLLGYKKQDHTLDKVLEWARSV